MKTPREILMEQHERAMPALDQIRRRALRQVAQPAVTTASPWRNLISGGRWQWATLATAWAIILLLNVSSSEGPPPTGAKSAPLAADLVLAVREHQRQIREWMDLAPVAQARPAPGPQSLRRLEFFCA